MAKMHAILWDGHPYPSGLRWGQVERPVPPEGWVLVRNLVAGICGSDLHYLSGAMVHQLPATNFPAVLGHENAGEVVTVGPGVKEWVPGDRVAAEPLHPCRTLGPQWCDSCIAGQYHRCSRLSFVGIPTNLPLKGGYGEYSIYHASNLFRLPDGVTFEEAALLDVLACGVHAAHVGQPDPGHTIAVLGCGPIGLGMLQVLCAVGVRDIVALAKHPFQADMARSLGASATICLGEMPSACGRLRDLIGTVDQVYECVGGTADTLQQAVDLCRRGGKIVIVGFFTGVKSVNLEKVFLDELSIHAADAYSTHGEKREFAIALSLLSRRQVNLKCLISHTFPRDAWRQALDAAFDRASSHAIKVVFAG